MINEAETRTWIDVVTEPRQWPWHVIVPSALTVVMGVWGLESTTLWFDEQMTLFASSWPLYHLWEAPLVPYYFLMYAWTFTGDFAPDWWLRLSSVVTMSLAVGFTAAASRRLVGRRAALGAGITLALMPGVTRYAQEARVYALAVMLVAFSTWILLRVVARPTRRLWLVYALSLASIGIFAPFAYAVVPAHAVVVWLDPRFRPYRRSWILASATNIPLLVALIVLVERYSEMHNWVPAPTTLDLLTSLPQIAMSTAVGVVVLLVALTNRDGVRWVIAAAAGMFSLWLISFGPSSFWIDRSFIALAPILAIAVGFGYERMRSWLMVLVIVLILGFALPSYLADREPDARGLNAHRITEIIDQHGKSGDVVSTAINYGLSWTVQHYMPGDERFSFAPYSDGRIWVADTRVECERLGEFPISDQWSLVLCASLPEGWETTLS